MSRRIGALAAAAVLALALSACQSNASGSDSGGSGGSSAGSGGGSSSDAGKTPYRDLDSAAAAVVGHDQHGQEPTQRSSKAQFGGCQIWMGVSWDLSDDYMPSADKYGIGGHVQWKCVPGAAGVDRWNIHARLQFAYTASGPWTTEAEDTADLHIAEAPKNGVRFPYTGHCTTDKWRLAVDVDGAMDDMTQIRQTLYSQWRQVTPEDCARE